MEVLGILAVLAVLALPVAVIVLLVAVSRLKGRVDLLERRLNIGDVPIPPAVGQSRTPDEGAGSHGVVAAAASAGVAHIADDAADMPGLESPEAAPTAEEPIAARPRDPWGSRPTGDATPPPVSPPARAVRTGPSAAERFGEWLKLNWVYAVSALSLALAGIFFVQYGIENGLLPPAARVAAAILFGLVLIGAGDWLRRRWGDREDDATAYLPSTFSGAGLVSIFGGVVAARQLYGLIGPETAMLGLVATALLAIVLGWFYGPFLAAVGLIGASVAPFVVGGESDAPYWLYAYFAVIAGIGLFVDTVRRWAWVSVLAVVPGIVGGYLTFVGAGGAGWFALMLVAVAFLTVLVPARGLLPDHAGAMMIGMLRRKGAERPIFPTVLAAGTVLAVSLYLLFLRTGTGAESLLVYFCLIGLALALTVWSVGARALSDLTVLPAAAFLLRLGFEGLDYGPLAQEFSARAIAIRPPETAAPFTMTLLLALATVLTLAAAFVSGGAGRLKPFWAAGAALVAPLAALVLELFWAPSEVIGAYPWALHVIALAPCEGACGMAALQRVRAKLAAGGR